MKLAGNAAARGAPFVALHATLLVALAVGGCTSGTTPELSPSRPPESRASGTFLRRRLDELSPKVAEQPAPRRASTPAAPAFVSSFGHAIGPAPLRHGEPSREGRDLNYWVLGDGGATALLLGGIHGDERSSTEAAYDLLEWVAAHPESIAGVTLVVAPEVNPDGNATATRRNARDVDLNRNFPSRNWRSGSGDHGPGADPASEPETRFVLRLLEIYRPDRVIATHAAAACVNWDGPAEALAERMSRECGLPVEATIGYPTPGSLGSYLGIDRGVPTITFELSTKERVGAAQQLPVRAALLAGIRGDAGSDDAAEDDAAKPPWFNDRPAAR